MNYKKINFGFKDINSTYNREKNRYETTGKIRISDHKGNEIGKHPIKIETIIHQMFDKNHKSNGFGSLDVFDFCGEGIEIGFTPKINITGPYSQSIKAIIENETSKYIQDQYHNRIARQEKSYLLVN